MRNTTTSVDKPRCVSMVSGLAFMFSIFFVVVGIYRLAETINGDIAAGFQELLVFSKQNNNSTGFARKLLLTMGDDNDDGDGAGGGRMNRIGRTCSKDNIIIFQGPTNPLPNGIPTYTVQILNVCVSGCSISNIHLSCGWFSSARLINPRLFKRIYYDDCLVNNGEALSPGESLSFQYANSFRYPLSVSSIACL